jgi:uncharacterized protein YjbI with pentapeptide repeats
MIVNTENPIGTGKSAFPLTRADIEQLRSTLESPAQLDLHLQNLQEIDLSYMDLQGANLQGANLRGTNLSEANLQGANLSEADLDGADLSRALLGDTEASCLKLHRAKLSYATLRELDLRGLNLAELDLQNADLNGTDLRGAVLRGANLQGADLSTARLNGPELQGAILHRGPFLGDRGEYLERRKGTRKRGAPTQAPLIEEHSSPLQEREGKQIVSEREAYLLGEQALLVGSDAVKLRGLFPQGFTFAQARHLFDTWLVQTGDNYQESEIVTLLFPAAYHPKTNEGRVGKSALSTGLASSLTHTSGKAWRRASMLR